MCRTRRTLLFHSGEGGMVLSDPSMAGVHILGFVTFWVGGLQASLVLSLCIPVYRYPVHMHLEEGVEGLEIYQNVE